MVMPLIADNFPLSHDTFLEDTCIELEEDTASIHSYETIPDSPVFGVQVSNGNEPDRACVIFIEFCLIKSRHYRLKCHYNLMYEGHSGAVLFWHRYCFVN